MRDRDRERPDERPPFVERVDLPELPELLERRVDRAERAASSPFLLLKKRYASNAIDPRASVRFMTMSPFL
ncbi:MAG: hypothetical protein AB7T31_03875 [Gemmatimonadales bacterium]